MKHNLISLILVLALLLGLALPAAAAEEEAAPAGETIPINCLEDFLAFADNCSLDTWSQDKTVVLNVDLSLENSGFLPIPTFGGSFYGNGHTIRGLSLTESINPGGLFSHLQSTALVKDLTVEGAVTPHGDASIVGGIAGQIEPEIALVLSPDYLETLSDQFERLGGLVSTAGSHAATAGGEVQSCIQKIAAYEKNAKSALEALGASFQEGNFSDGISDAVQTLTNSIQGIASTTDQLKNAVAESVDGLGDDANAISGQIGSISRTFALATEDYGEDTIADVSDADIANVREGKVLSCTNSGTVEADMNAGGIVGIMGLEYQLDPEDDTMGGKATQRRRYELKAIVQSCVNSGSVAAKRSYAGGICGRMELGLITASESYGTVSSESGSYVGGIAGLTGGTIRSCFAKCTLSGGDYIGGIVGSGITEDLTGESSTVTGCYSMVEIPEYGQYIGAISGGNSGIFTENYFVSDVLAGINRVSHTALAEPMSYEALLSTEGLPQPLRRLTLSFVVEGETIKFQSFDYGDSFDASVYPEIPEKEGHYASWDTNSLENLHFDTVVTAEYFPHITSLYSDDVTGGKHLLYVQGQFQEGDALTLSPGTTDFEPGEGETLTAQYILSIPADGLESHTIRYLPEEDTVIYLLKNGIWTEAVTEELGSYLAFTAPGAEVEFAAVHREFNWAALLHSIAAAAGLALSLAAIVLLLWKKGKKTRIIFAVVFLLAAVGCGIYCFWGAKTAEVIHAYDILNDYVNQPEQAMDLTIKAKFSDQELGAAAEVRRATVEGVQVTRIQESGRTLYFADNAVFLDSGAAYKVNSDAPDYSRILDRLLEIHNLTEVEAANGIYSITAGNAQAKRILELLTPGANSLLSDTLSLTVDLVTEAETLTEIHFTGAGNLADSVKTPFSVSAMLTIRSTEAVEIPKAVTEAIASGN